MKKDSFKIFNPLVEKRSKSVVLEDEICRPKIRGFRYFPSTAFTSISHINQFTHLKEGLYVAEKKLRHMPDYVSKIDRNVFPNNIYTSTGSVIWPNVDWREAKTVASSLGGRIMSLPEYFCVNDWLSLEDDEDMLTDMKLKESEYLDGLIERIPDKTRRKSMRKDTYRYHMGAELKDGNAPNGLKDIFKNEDHLITDVPYTLKIGKHQKGWFKRSGVDDELGLPGFFGIEKWFGFEYYDNDPIAELIFDAQPVKAAVRGRIEEFGHRYPELNFNLSPFYRSIKTDIRLCYTAEKILGKNDEKDKKEGGVQV